MQTITINLNIDASKSPFALPASLWQSIQDFLQFIHSFDTDGVAAVRIDLEMQKMVDEGVATNDPYSGYFGYLWDKADKWPQETFPAIQQVAQFVQQFGSATFPAGLTQIQSYPEKFYNGNYTNADYAAFKNIVEGMWTPANQTDLQGQDIDWTLKQMVHALGDFSYLDTCLQRIYASYDSQYWSNLTDLNLFKNTVTADYFNQLKNNLQILQSTWDTLSSEIGNATVSINQMDNETPQDAFNLVDDFNVASASWSTAANDAGAFLSAVH